jgi:hypothetical protein
MDITVTHLLIITALGAAEFAVEVWLAKRVINWLKSRGK